MTKTALIKEIESQQIKTDIPDFSIGDTINVSVRIIEGDKERIQIFTGTVIARKGCGLSETVTLYRVSYGSSMERVFNLHSPRISKIEVGRRGKVRRSKLYYLRGKKGKKSKVREQLFGAKGSAKIVSQESAPKEKEVPVEAAPVEEVKEAPKAAEPKKEKPMKAPAKKKEAPAKEAKEAAPEATPEETKE